MNKVILIGNLTRDPEVLETTSGITFCRFSIAVNRAYTNADGERGVDFINVIAWRGLAENIGKYCKKGNKVCVVGSLENVTYEKDDGRRTYAQITATDVEFLSAKKSDTATDGETDHRNENPRKTANTAAIRQEYDDDDLPF